MMGIDVALFYIDDETQEFKVAFNDEFLTMQGVDVDLFYETFSAIQAQDFIEYLVQHIEGSRN